MIEQGSMEAIAETVERLLGEQYCFLLVVIPASGTGPAACIANAEAGACVNVLDQCKQAIQRRGAGMEDARGLH